jgi:hypothetical protein
MLTDSHSQRSACFTKVASATFTEDAGDASSYFWGSIFGLVFTNEDCKVCFILKTVLILYCLTIRLSFSDTPLT